MFCVCIDVHVCQTIHIFVSDEHVNMLKKIMSIYAFFHDFVFALNSPPLPPPLTRDICNVIHLLMLQQIFWP